MAFIGSRISGSAAEGSTPGELWITGSVTIVNDGFAAGELRLREDNDNGLLYTGFKAAAQTTENSVYTMPAAYPDSDKVLQSDSSCLLYTSDAADE